MSIEKLKQAIQLLQECVDEYEGEESGEGESPVEESSGEVFGGGANDKIKMAAALMRRGK